MRELPITGYTGLTCLLGHPAKHSISPAMHNEAFHYHGLDYVYLAFDVEEDRFEQAVDGLIAMNARGWNCTMPFKRAMCERVDVLSEEARLTGSVNTVVQENGVLTGYNTDGKGYMRAVKDAGYQIIGGKMTLFGAGGAAASIIAQAALDGVRGIDLFARPGASWDAVSQVVSRVNESTDCRICMYPSMQFALDAEEFQKFVEDAQRRMRPEGEEDVRADEEESEDASWDEDNQEEPGDAAWDGDIHGEPGDTAWNGDNQEEPAGADWEDGAEEDV